MKHLSKFLLAAFLLISTTSFGQNLKFGHIDIEQLVSVMPDRDSAVAILNKYGMTLQETLQDMQIEFQTKYNTFERQQATWTAAVLETRRKELQELDQRLAEYQQSAQEEYAQMQNALVAPVYQQAQATVEKIGRDKGLVYVFNTSNQPLLYIDENISEDLLPIAKRELGIPADKVPMQISQQQ